MERFGREDFGPFIKGVESGIQIPLQIHKFPYYSYSRGQARRRSQEHDRRRSQKLLQARRVCQFLTVMSFLTVLSFKMTHFLCYTVNNNVYSAKRKYKILYLN